MITNVCPVADLRSLARAKAREYETKTVHPLLVDEALSQGWMVDRKNKRSVRLRRPKSHGLLLEDRVWTLLYKTGFEMGRAPRCSAC